MPIVDDSETSGKNKKVTVEQLKTHIAAASSGVGGTMDSSIIPDANAAHDIGSAEFKIRHLYLSDNSLYMAPPDVLESGSMAKIGSVLSGDGVTRKLSMSGVDLSSDVVVDDASKGIVLKSSNGHYWRLTIDDGGNLVAEDVGIEKP